MIQCQERLLENVNKRTIQCEDRFWWKEQRFVECHLTLNKMLIQGQGKTKEIAEKDVEKRYKKEMLEYCKRNCPVLNKERYEDVKKRFNVVYVNKG